MWQPRDYTGAEPMGPISLAFRPPRVAPLLDSLDEIQETIGAVAIDTIMAPAGSVNLQVYRVLLLEPLGPTPGAARPNPIGGTEEPRIIGQLGDEYSDEQQAYQQAEQVARKLAVPLVDYCGPTPILRILDNVGLGDALRRTPVRFQQPEVPPVAALRERRDARSVSFAVRSAGLGVGMAALACFAAALRYGVWWWQKWERTGQWNQEPDWQIVLVLLPLALVLGFVYATALRRLEVTDTALILRLRLGLRRIPLTAVRGVRISSRVAWNQVEVVPISAALVILTAKKPIRIPLPLDAAQRMRWTIEQFLLRPRPTPL